ncbi:MAG: hypothetical protein KJ687_05140, partial [Proteobacteria bacterium]|nr:hypothetical protein [Pseudomonadota bacterium]
MGNKLYGYWALAEISTGIFLLGGISGWVQFTAFLCSHGLTIALTYMLFGVLIGGDSRLRKDVITRGFLTFLAIVANIPLIGPAAVLFLIVFLRYFPIYPVRTESFRKINKDVLMVMQKKIEARSIPITEALLIRGISREQSLKMVAVIGEMDWAPAKAGILKYIIRLSPFQNVVLMAIDMLRKKLDGIIAEIVRMEAVEHPDAGTFRMLANLYHEICFLDLSEPIMKRNYQNKACEYALKAFKTKKQSEEDALLAVKYLLESDRVGEAKEVYDHIRNTG